MFPKISEGKKSVLAVKHQNNASKTPFGDEFRPILEMF